MENVTLEESIITALDGADPDLVPYIPYILQDFWEIGTPPEDIIEIIRKFNQNYSGLNVLDLGSGKGAVSIKIASELKCNCLGIDAIEEFVTFSNNKAKEYAVSNICSFEVNDIRARLNTLGKYDVIVLGAIGPVFGNYYETLTKLESHLYNDGLIIINDAYAEDDCKDYPNILRKNDLLKQTESAGMELVFIITDDGTTELDDEYKIELENITKRCMELVEKYPDDKNLFLRFIEKQTREYETLNNDIIPAIFVFKRGFFKTVAIQKHMPIEIHLG